MLNFLKSIPSLGLEFSSGQVKGAEIHLKQGKATIAHLFTHFPEEFKSYVKPLYIDHPFVTTALDGADILVRPITIPLTKDKDIEAALAFQAEPYLPYPIDEALLARQTLTSSGESTDLTLLSTRKNLLNTHLEQWHLLDTEPETVSCIQSALASFAKNYLEKDKTYLMVHLQDKSTSCILIEAGRLIASCTQSEGLQLLQQAYLADAPDQGVSAFDQMDYTQLSSQHTPRLYEAVSRLQKMIAMGGLATLKEAQGGPCEGVLFTGDVVNFKGLPSQLNQLLKQPMASLSSVQNYSAMELQNYAIPLGLALGSLPTVPHPINFRQHELSFPYPWQRIKKNLALYFVAMFCLTAAFYLFSHASITSQEDQMKQEYLDLLGKMNKSYVQFESNYLSKNPTEKKDEELVPIEKLNREELEHRLAYLQRDLLATPDSFPLHANIPRVSDLLAWLSQHPTVVGAPESNGEPRIQIDNFNYILVKRPMLGKKNDKYQVKVEMEFTSSTPKWAREFHDALIAPNDWIDAKNEVKWSSNRGKYKTSFFLKDKTHYPGQ